MHSSRWDHLCKGTEMSVPPRNGEGAAPGRSGVETNVG